jgi:hypothetical protein
VGLILSLCARQSTGILRAREFEVALGGTYDLSPGRRFVAELEYEERHQGRFDFVADTVVRVARRQGVTDPPGQLVNAAFSA